MNSPNPLSRQFTIEPTDAKSPDLLVIARALWAGKWQIAAIIAVAIGLAAIHDISSEPKYTARAILSLEGMARKLMDFDKSRDSAAADEKNFETEAEVLRSRVLVENLVQQLSLIGDPEFNPTLQAPEVPSVDWALDRLRQFAGLEPPPHPDDKAVQAVTTARTLQAISIRPIQNTYLIEVDVETNSPEKSAEIANTLASLYIAARRESDLEANTQGSEWLSVRVGELKEALEAAEMNVSEFRASAEVSSPEALAAQNEQLKALRDRYAHSQRQIGLAATRLALLDDVIKSTTPETVAAVGADLFLSQAIGGDWEQSPGSPDSDAELRRLAKAEADRIEAETDRERGRAEMTAAAKAELEARIERQSREIVQLRQLEREVDANVAIYEFALNRLKQLSVERGIEQAPVRVLSKAEPPLGPSSPGFGVVAALAVVLGGFVGVVIILVRQGVQELVQDGRGDREAVEHPGDRSGPGAAHQSATARDEVHNLGRRKSLLGVDP